LADGGVLVKKTSNEIEALKNVLNELRNRGKVLLAYLFGSYSKNASHKKSDIDLALYLNTKDENETIEVIDKIFMVVDKSVEILRLDDEDESPFIIQEALKGIPLIEPDTETFYKVADRVLHETEGIRFKRGIVFGAK
jgi:predicted nucleotidyltransferase